MEGDGGHSAEAIESTADDIAGHPRPDTHMRAGSKGHADLTTAPWPDGVRVIAESGRVVVRGDGRGNDSIAG
jgi:hypothetical protein